MKYRARALSLKLVREQSYPLEGKIFKGSEEVRAFATSLIRESPIEQFMAFFLASGHQLIGFSIQKGTVNQAPVFPAEVFKLALLCNACALIVAHNHPSQDLTPSYQDQALTCALKDGSKLLGISFIDHLILDGEEKYFSFREKGLL